MTVPYIVRNERGTIDRGIYDIAILYDPSKPWTPTTPQTGWNGKVGGSFGGSCGPFHVQTANTSAVLDETALERGFAVATSGLNVLGNNCNEAVSAEALMMVKEHLARPTGRSVTRSATGARAARSSRSTSRPPIRASSTASSLPAPSPTW